jgi:hypothetical protein
MEAQDSQAESRLSFGENILNAAVEASSGLKSRKKNMETATAKLVAML